VKEDEGKRRGSRDVPVLSQRDPKSVLMDRARERGVRAYAEITRVARMAPVIKLTVEISGKHGNNGHLYTWEVERERQKSKSCIPDERSPRYKP